MKDYPLQIARHFCEKLIDDYQPAQLPILEQYFEEGGSVCALARKGVAGLASEYGLEIKDAQALSLRLNGLATWVLRRYIEDQLTDNEPTPTHLRQGVLAWDNGPTYDGLFRPNFANKCPPDAIEAIHSPVAYAVWLKHWSENRLTPSNESQAYKLNTRRKDLDKLVIDPVTAHGIVSSVEVASVVLEESIKASLGQLDSLNMELNRRRYPNGLPYHHPWVTLDELTRGLGMSLGTVAALCDPQYPYFLHALPWEGRFEQMLTQAARLSPSQRQMFTEARHFPTEDSEEYFKENFGLLNIEAGNLPQAPFFNQRTKLTQPGLEALLSVELSAPTVSKHALVVFAGDAVTPGHAFSVFINDGSADTSMGITYGGIPALNKISGTSDDRFDRLNRKIRLDNALKLPSHETDVLLEAIIVAESGGGSRPFWMTDNTVRALGLFQMAREYYQCSAEDFAVFVGNISIFGRGAESSQFDRVFNKDTLSMPPLLMDDQPFALMPETEADALTVAQICSGLNIDLATYFTLAPVIAQAHNLTALKRSIPVLSSFYRLAKLPQMLGIAPNLGVELLNVLSGNAWVTALAGVAHINAERKVDVPDVLTVIQRLVGWVRWCADSGLDVAWAIEHVKPVPAPPHASEAQTRLFAQIRSQLTPALFTEDALRMAGVRALSNNRQWANQLLELADQDGLVIHRIESVDQPYALYAREVVERVVFQVIGQSDQQTVEQILGVLLSCRSGQSSVAQEGLAVYGELAPNLALLVLSWSGGTVHDVLLHILGRTSADSTLGSRQREEEPGDPFLGMLSGFVCRCDVAKELKLSVEFLSLYLTLAKKVGVHALAPEPLMPIELYALTVYNRAVKLSNKPESRLLSYLQRIDALPDDLSGDGLRLVKEQAARLLAEIFNWSAEEVRLCADHINAGQGYIRTLEHLDLLTRLRAFVLQSKLDTPTVLKMGTLDPDSPFSAYEALANQVAALLAEQRRTLSLPGISVVADQVMIEYTVDQTELIANSDDSAQFTVTITRAGVAQKNVNVYFASKLCTVDPRKATTGEDGTVKVTVHAGKTMGRDVISYQLDARDPQSGPSILLVNDPTTFAFYKLDNEIYTTTEKIGTDVTLRLRLNDVHGNPAPYVPVMWLLEPLFSFPVAGITNVEGVTEITFSSPDPLVINAPKVTKEDASLTLRPITFTE